MNIPSGDADRLRELLPKLEAVLALAHANFPSTSAVTISVGPAGGHTASFSVPWYDLKMLTDLGREALKATPPADRVKGTR